jgi:hypothetical protein
MELQRPNPKANQEISHHTFRRTYPMPSTMGTSSRRLMLRNARTVTRWGERRIVVAELGDLDEFDLPIVCLQFDHHIL